MDEYVRVKDLIEWLQGIPENAIVCSSEEGNDYPIDYSDLSIGEFDDETFAVFIG